MYTETRMLPSRIEVLITNLDYEPFRNEDVSRRERTYCTCTWQPFQVRFVWEMREDGGWRLIDRMLYCRPITETGALGRVKTFDFSPLPRMIPDIHMPAWIIELERENTPMATDECMHGKIDECEACQPKPREETPAEQPPQLSERAREILREWGHGL